MAAPLGRDVSCSALSFASRGKVCWDADRLCSSVTSVRVTLLQSGHRRKGPGDKVRFAHMG